MESANHNNCTHFDRSVKDFAGLNDWSPHHGLSEPEAGAGVGAELCDDTIVGDRFSASATSGCSDGARILA
jgi:hypothetical protein